MEFKFEINRWNNVERILVAPSMRCHAFLWWRWSSACPEAQKECRYRYRSQGCVICGLSVDPKSGRHHRHHMNKKWWANYSLSLSICEIVCSLISTLPNAQSTLFTDYQSIVCYHDFQMATAVSSWLRGRVPSTLMEQFCDHSHEMNSLASNHAWLRFFSVTAPGPAVPLRVRPRTTHACTHALGNSFSNIHT